MEAFMKKSLLTLCSLFLFTSFVFGEGLGNIGIDIQGIKDKPKGRLICFVFNSKESFLQESKALQILDAKVGANNAFCEFTLPINQEYAVAILDDENGNRILDKNSFGQPKEGWATSNNITHAFSAPSFEESKFIFKEKPMTLTLMMHY
jgi:uncharacterized protein (DUF2141 family)